MPVCDVCSRPMSFSEGYALTTSEVATSSSYWERMLNAHSFTDDSLLLMYVQQQAMQRSGWLVCESCSAMFSFDRAARAACAQRQQDPPGSGPADANHVAAAAARAWRTAHGALPSWAR